jgi:hypothetical protein
MKRSTTTYVQLQCKYKPSCQWYLRGRYHKNSDSFEISELKEPYICHNNSIKMMFTIVKAEINIKIATIQATIHKDFLYNISYKKAWLAK